MRRGQPGGRASQRSGKRERLLFSEDFFADQAKESSQCGDIGFGEFDVTLGDVGKSQGSPKSPCPVRWHACGLADLSACISAWVC
jgi:hypothetical protein